MNPYFARLRDITITHCTDITHGDVKNPSQIIATTFNSRYIHTDLNHREFLQVALKDPRLKEVYRDDQAVIFEVIDE